jgi:hypothetical protein
LFAPGSVREVAVMDRDVNFELARSFCASRLRMTRKKMHRDAEKENAPGC